MSARVIDIVVVCTRHGARTHGRRIAGQIPQLRHRPHGSAGTRGICHCSAEISWYVLLRGDFTGSQVVSTTASFDTDKWDTSPAAIAARVLADHARALVFLTADGVLPTVSSRGYVLRRILRRAARYARVQGVTEPCLARLVPVVVETMGTAYPEIRTHASVAADMATREESFFQDMLSRGWRALEVDRSRPKNVHFSNLKLCFGPTGGTGPKIGKSGGCAACRFRLSAPSCPGYTTRFLAG